MNEEISSGALLGGLWAFVGLFGSPPLGLAAAGWVAQQLAGPNVSDVGVPMHSHGLLAILGGLGTYTAIVALAWWLVSSTLEISSPWAWGAAGLWGALLLLALLAVLAFGYG
jgi:hypothetical protein